jgi:hypothetical protein
VEEGCFGRAGAWERVAEVSGFWLRLGLSCVSPGRGESGLAGDAKKQRRARPRGKGARGRLCWGSWCCCAWLGGLWAYSSCWGLCEASKSLDRENGVFVFAEGRVAFGAARGGWLGLSVSSQVVFTVFNAGRCRVGGGRPFGAGLVGRRPVMSGPVRPGVSVVCLPRLWRVGSCLPPRSGGGVVWFAWHGCRAALALFAWMRVFIRAT